MPELDSSLLASITDDLFNRGATSVSLTGSHARDEADEFSDIDLLVLGEGSSRLRSWAGRLVSECWTTPELVRAGFAQPHQAVWMVPGWRQARPLRDPGDEAMSLKRLADGWRWTTSLSQAADAWVASEICALAEDSVRLGGHLTMGNRAAAAVMRNVLAGRLAQILAVHLRILYSSENGLWDLAGRRLAGAWPRWQSQALTLDGERLEESCHAAIQLYLLAVEATRPILTIEQRAVVEVASVLLPPGGIIP